MCITFSVPVNTTVRSVMKIYSPTVMQMVRPNTILQSETHPALLLRQKMATLLADNVCYLVHLQYFMED